MSEDHLVPSGACLEDAELLDSLWFNRPHRQFTVSPAQVELQHSKSVFQDLISKHDRCHEATFGLGRISVLEREFDVGLAYLQDAVAMTGADPVYYAWLAWAFLLDSPSKGLMKRSSNLSRACQFCQQALQMSRDCALALRCLVHLAVSLPLSASGGWPAALSHAKTFACAHPVPGLYVVARTLLQDPAWAQIGISGLKQCISEIPISGERADEVAAVISEQSLGSEAPVLIAVGADARSTSSSAAPSSDTPLWQAWDRKVVSVKLLALDTLWRYLKESRLQEEAAEVALLAIAALRACPAAWQRAVCLALKSLAFQGRWDQCWHLAAAELAYQQSFEVLYQCGRLAFYDGRHEAVDAYLPHLCAMLPVVPAVTRADVQFWIGMLYHKRGHGLLAVRSLQAAVTSLEAHETPKRRKKIERCQGIIDSVTKLEAEVKRIYEFSNEALKSAIERHTVARPSKDMTASALEAAFSVGLSGDRAASLDVDDEEGTTLFASDEQPAASPEPPESFGWVRLALPERSAYSNASDLRKCHELAMSDLQSSLYSAPWKILGSWRGAKTATSVEIDDPYLGKMCRGRLTLIQGDAAGAETLWESAASEFPAHLEPYVELWQLHSAQGIHKKAVLDIRRAVELTMSGKSAWGKYIPVPLDLLLHGKLWPGVGAGTSLDIEQVVHLLLAKSLCRCRLWEHAWQALCTGRDSSGRLAEGAFSYQMGKLCVTYVQELLAAHLREKQNASGLMDEGQAHCASSGAFEGSAAATSAGNEVAQKEDAPCGNDADDATRGDEFTEVDLWLERARKHLDAFVKYESTEADHRKGLIYRTKLDACTMMLSRLRQLCQQRSVPIAAARVVA